MKLKEITDILEEFAPLSLQESYDNSGLIIGEYNQKIKSAIITLDVTEKIIDEAITEKIDLIISHHPIIFKGIKTINGKNETERIIKKAIKKDISIYAYHTNADNIIKGVNGVVADKLKLKNVRVLSPVKGQLRKLVTFGPTKSAAKILDALFKAGAGHIGNYDSCSFNMEGIGSFRGNDQTNPHVGKKNELHFEDEVRIETVYPVYLERNIIKALLANHPYEEVAYDLYSLENEFLIAGAGIIGEIEKPIPGKKFLNILKKEFNTGCIKHTEILDKEISKVAFCGGAGSFLIPNAKAAGADVFVTGDIKYHDYFQCAT